jgi:hypothetical protein
MPFEFAGDSDNLGGLAVQSIMHSANSNEGYARGPERGLLRAVLFDGLLAYVKFAHLGSSQYREAHAWVHDQSSDYVFAFGNVCEALGLNPSRIRTRLLKLVAAGQAQGNKRMRRAA